ncbi:uncharacterized protein [Apostichopus japonicus]|uniref:uncharacterized protein n=1 Tax=Stichopus japonicus TaxID=307972 RepID=UPI003AB28DE6
MGLTGRQKRVLLGKYPTLNTPKERSEEQETSSGLRSDLLEGAGPSTISTRSFTTSTSVRLALNPKRRRVSSEKRQRKEVERDSLKTTEEAATAIHLAIESEGEWRSLKCHKASQTVVAGPGEEKVYRRSAGVLVNTKTKSKG